MQTNDDLFFREFKDMMNGRKSLSRTLNLVDLPLPSIKSMTAGVPKLHMALVKGVKEPFFDRLNTKEVQLIGRTQLKKRQVMSDGNFQRDKDGKYMYIQVPVPHGSVAILSTLSIGLRRYVGEGDKKRQHVVSDGFRYVDYVENNGTRKYIYIIPKEYVYRLNMCALIMTPNKRRSFYRGSKLALQNGNYVYLYVVPYQYRDILDQRVLGVKSSFNFDEEVSDILAYWMQIGVIFNLRATALDSQVNGITNLGILPLEGTCVSEDFVRHGVSLAAEREEAYIQNVGTED